MDYSISSMMSWFGDDTPLLLEIFLIYCFPPFLPVVLFVYSKRSPSRGVADVYFLDVCECCSSSLSGVLSILVFAPFLGVALFDSSTCFL